MSRSDSTLRRFSASNRGAVMVEFAIAFMPIFTLFLVFMEVTRWTMAKMAMQHSAGISARACAVIRAPQNQGTDKVDGDPATDIQQAGETALNVWTGKNKVTLNGLGPPIKNGAVLTNVKVTCTPDPATVGGTDEATVEADYICGIPLANRLVCGSTRKTKITTKARFAHQGASYTL